jgi:hypothetical protein
MEASSSPSGPCSFLSSRFGRQRSSQARGSAWQRSTCEPESTRQRGTTSLLQPRRSSPPLPSPARPRWIWRERAPHGRHRAIARERRGRTALLRSSTTPGRTGRPRRLARRRRPHQYCRAGAFVKKSSYIRA